MDIVGAPWTLLIIDEFLRHDRQRFQDLQVRFPAVSLNTPSARLKTFEAHGITKRRFYQQHPPQAVYGLTERGQDLALAIDEFRERARACQCPITDDRAVTLVAQQVREAISRCTKEGLAIAKARGVKLGNPDGATTVWRGGKGARR